MKISIIIKRINESKDNSGSATITPHKVGYSCCYHVKGRVQTRYYKNIEMDVSMKKISHLPQTVKNTDYFYFEWDKRGEGAFSPVKYINFYRRMGANKNE